MCRIELFDKYAWPNNAKFDKGEIIRAIDEICFLSNCTCMTEVKMISKNSNTGQKRSENRAASTTTTISEQSMNNSRTCTPSHCKIRYSRIFKKVRLCILG